MSQQFAEPVAGCTEQVGDKPVKSESGTDRGPFVGEQCWRDLLFAHWPVQKNSVERLLPPGLEIDLWADTAWIGIVPFDLKGLRARYLPGLPGMTNFLELNVRTYVRESGRPGIYFFSLDASSRTAVAGARTALGLPYFCAEMSCTRRDQWIDYRSVREGSDAVFEASYRPTGDAAEAETGSLEEFLVERYRLFTTILGKLFRLEIDHPPWQLRAAEAEIRTNTMASAAGLSLPAVPPRLHFVERQGVVTALPIPDDPDESS
jgi:uncharacterized protein YqjF (DUF2071 family)